MKVNIDINFDDVNYDEIEEVDEMTLYDTLDGWIDESVYFEFGDDKVTMVTPDDDEPFVSDGEYIDAEDFGHGVTSRYESYTLEAERWYQKGIIDNITYTEILKALNYVVYDVERIRDMSYKHVTMMTPIDPL